MPDKDAQKEGLAAELGRFIHRFSYEDLPSETGEMAKGRILDALACCFAARALPSSQAAAALARDCPGDCTIFGYGHKTSMLDAAMINGVMAHTINQDDMMAGGVVHPAAAIVPAAIAVAEHMKASGAEVLLAIVLGYEITWRMLKATGRLSAPFRTTTVFTGFGAATAAGKLMRLGEREIGHALGYAASLAIAAPGEGWNSGTPEPMFQVGMTARTGILCGLIARSGGTASPLALEGRHGFLRGWSSTGGDVAEATQGLGQSFAIARTIIKPFAVCGINQVAVQMASTLARHNLSAANITRIAVKLRPGTSDFAGTDNPGPFSSHVQAAMSMQFSVAAAIMGKPLDTPRFALEHYSDPEVAGLAAKVELVGEEGRSVPGFEVYTADGRVLTVNEPTFDRSIHVPTLEGMKRKFRLLSAGSLGEADTEEITDLVMRLETLKDTRKLTAKLGCS